MASLKTTIINNNIGRHKKQRIVPNNGKGRPQQQQMPSNNLLFLLLLLLLILPLSSLGITTEKKGLSMLARPQQRISSQSNNNQRNNSPRLPFNVILILPERESNNDKFGLTVSKVRPVIDIAVEDVIKHGRMPPGWINITYHDSRYWEDTLLAERVSATGVIQAYCEKRLDAILGFADAYSLATVSKISAGFGEGIPVLTTTGLTSIIGSKKSYPYVTRMRGSYTQMAEAAYKFVAQHEEEEEGQQIQQKSSINLNYQKILFMYHDKRRAINKPSSGNRRGESGGGPEESPSSSCYFSLYAIKEYFQDHPIYLEAWRKTPTPNVAFDEELPRSREEVAEWVKLASIRANGELNNKIGCFGNISK